MVHSDGGSVASSGAYDPQTGTGWHNNATGTSRSRRFQSRLSAAVIASVGPPSTVPLSVAGAPSAASAVPASAVWAPASERLGMPPVAALVRPPAPWLIALEPPEPWSDPLP